MCLLGKLHANKLFCESLFQLQRMLYKVFTAGILQLDFEIPWWSFGSCSDEYLQFLDEFGQMPVLLALHTKALRQLSQGACSRRRRMIRVLDHFIVAERIYSFAEHGCI